FAPRPVLREPAWPEPDPVRLGSAPLRLRSGDLELLHARDQLGGFRIRVRDRDFADGLTRPLLGYLAGDETVWLDLARQGRTRAVLRGSAITVDVSAAGPDGAAWHL